MNFLTELREGLAISWAAIRANKLRSTLTTLGIVIGVLTVTLMGTAIEGLNRAFLKTVSIIGADVLYVERGSWFVHSHDEWMKVQKRRPITLDQIEALSKQMTHARAITPVTSTGQLVQFQRRHADNVTIFGTTDGFLQTMGMNIGEGRFISGAEAQSQRAVCVIGWAVATNLFGEHSGLGAKIMVGGHSFEVIGVLEQM